VRHYELWGPDWHGTTQGATLRRPSCAILQQRCVAEAVSKKMPKVTFR
jgi:hypothetical protein